MLTVVLKHYNSRWTHISTYFLSVSSQGSPKKLKLPLEIVFTAAGRSHPRKTAGQIFKNWPWNLNYSTASAWCFTNIFADVLLLTSCLIPENEYFLWPTLLVGGHASWYMHAEIQFHVRLLWVLLYCSCPTCCWINRLYYYDTIAWTHGKVPSAAVTNLLSSRVDIDGRDGNMLQLLTRSRAHGAESNIEVYLQNYVTSRYTCAD